MNRKSLIILIVGLLLFLTGIWAYPKIDQFFKIDSCLNAGGSWNYDTKKCEVEHNEENIDCSDFNFNSAEQQADSLLTFYKKATDSTSINRMKWEQKFFCAFPNSFKGMQSIFGYDEESGAAPLYSIESNTYSYIDRHIMCDVIGFFNELESIPGSTYYKKYIRINIDGRWEADNISEAFGFHHRLLNDTEKACQTLEKFTDEEVRSVFRFIFDGPHPKNEHNEVIFQSLKLEIEEQNERLGYLLYEVYATMTAEEADHGH